MLSLAFSETNSILTSRISMNWKELRTFLARVSLCYLATTRLVIGMGSSIEQVEEEEKEEQERVDVDNEPKEKKKNNRKSRV